MATTTVTSPWLYQILHPWHWMAYGQNASVVGLIVLVFYTVYTRRMMLIAQQTRLRELYPLLILQQAKVSEGYMEMEIINVGNGALLNASTWGQRVSEGFRLGDTFLERPSGVDISFAGTMVSQSNRTLRTTMDASASYSLEVVDGTDSVGGRHQFCFLRRFYGPGNYEHGVRMIHPAEFLPMWRRLMGKVLEWRARVSNAVRRSP